MKRNTRAKVASQQNLSGKQLKRPQMKFSKSLLKIMSVALFCVIISADSIVMPDRVRPDVTRILLGSAESKA